MFLRGFRLSKDVYTRQETEDLMCNAVLAAAAEAEEVEERYREIARLDSETQLLSPRALDLALTAKEIRARILKPVVGEEPPPKGEDREANRNVIDATVPKWAWRFRGGRRDS